LDWNSLVRSGTSGGVSLGDAISLSVFTEEGHSAEELIARVAVLLLRVDVVLRRPLEVFCVEVPVGAQPRVDGLDEVEVVSGVRTDPRRVEGAGRLRRSRDDPTCFVVSHAGTSGTVSDTISNPAADSGILSLDDDSGGDHHDENGNDSEDLHLGGFLKLVFFFFFFVRGNTLFFTQNVIDIKRKDC
jgi:hypothetical protein